MSDRRDARKVMSSTVDASCNLARSCEEADLASLGRTCDADQLYTDAALVRDTSTSVAAVAGSGLIDLHLHCVVVGTVDATCDPSACVEAQERNGGARGLTLCLLREERAQCTP